MIFMRLITYLCLHAELIFSNGKRLFHSFSGEVNDNAENSKYPFCDTAKYEGMYGARKLFSTRHTCGKRS